MTTPVPVTPAAEPPARALLDPAEMARALSRMAHQVLEKPAGAPDVVLLGIPTRGVPLAARLGART